MNEDGIPRLPTEGEYVRTYGRLVRIEDVTPKEIVLDYIFEFSEARVEGRINGKVVKTYATINDFYGEGTCVERAIQEAREQQDWLGESNMEFVVIKVTQQIRRRPVTHGSFRRENFYASEFIHMESLQHGSAWNLPDTVEEVVWSSSNGNRATGHLDNLQAYNRELTAGEVAALATPRPESTEVER